MKEDRCVTGHVNEVSFWPHSHFSLRLDMNEGEGTDRYFDVDTFTSISIEGACRDD